MRKARLVTIVLWATLWGLSPWLWNSVAYADRIPALKAVPAGLPDEVRERLSQQRQEIERELKDFQAAAFLFNDKPARDQTDEEYDKLQMRRVRYINAVTVFNKELANNLTVQIEALTVQILDTQAQLHGLGFNKRADDFEQIGNISSEAAARLKAKLFLRLQEMVMNQAENVMEDRFLKFVIELKPSQVKAMLAAMEKAGVADPYFLEWLRSFKADKPRAELVADAKLVIKFLKTRHDLGEFFAKLETGTINTQQEAALTLISLVLDHPYLKELKAVTAGTYDVAEAWFFIAVLDMSEKDLAAVTDSQLSSQKFLIKRMESLVRERNEARAELK